MQKIFSPKTNYWLKTLSKFASVQLVVQALGFASGILLIRNLDKQEYAYFVLANSMQGTMSVLADSGISSALSSIGGKVWQEPYRFGQLIKTAMQFKRYLAVIAVVIVAPILMWMLIKNGASWIYASILITGILIELHFYLSDGVMIVVPRLHSQFDRLQNLGLIASFTRIILLLGSSLFALNAAVGIFASTIASGLKNRLLWHWIKNIIRIDTPANQEDKQEIFKLVKLQAPASIFYCFQGQLSVWLISILGNTENIAELGALGRFSVIFALISSITLNIFTPAFAKCQTTKHLWNRYYIIIGIYLIFSLILLIASALFPNLFLLLLGDKYLTLEKEFFLMVVQITFYQLLILMSSLNSAKGWLVNPFILIILALSSQIVCLLCLDVSTLQGVIYLNIYSTIPGFFLAFYLTYKGINSLSSANTEY